MPQGRRISITGIVQGVGFRPWVYRLATSRGLSGWIRNHSGGVTIESFGPSEALDAFVADLQGDPPPAASIRSVSCANIPWIDLPAFTIESSDPSADRTVSIPADLPTCSRCLAEIRDPDNRRYRYAFTNCTDCGPRYTIAREVPYDRAATTMSGFRMCGLCQQEYDSPGDRRFHAQPNACPACGPRLSLLDQSGGPIACDDPILETARRLTSGAIVAIKGLGGFHLACDATSSEAVARLRARKRRDEKPFAVMVADLIAAEALAIVGPSERALLLSAERPVVLVQRRPETELADTVAPRNPLVGLLLPYTPLHHLLLDQVRRPLVMTSGNLSEEPIAFRDEEAAARLGAIADWFLTHDRPIETPCDDSVARVIASRTVIFRRSRGLVPKGIAIEHPLAQPTLGCGALLKNTFCLARGRLATFGPHIGDLENLETFESYRRIELQLERFLGIQPEIVAHDLHPDYLSTRFALERIGVRTIAVQHHHAHVAAAMAEHGLDGPVIGIAYDGTGLGPDGAAWGGEVLLATFAGFTRLATWRPIALAGGDHAIRDVWRQALALLFDAFEGDPPLERLSLFDAIDPREIAVIRQMLSQGVNLTRAHGIGRYFDAIGALGLGIRRSRFEGQVALEWNLIARPDEQSSYDVTMERSNGLLTIDARPAVRAIVRDLIDGIPPAVVSARFHNSLVGATSEVVREIAALHGRLPVVLTGGCFQNERLAEGIARELGQSLDVYLHGSVPPGDGGLSLGQVMIANAAVQSGRLGDTEGPCA